MKWNFLKKVDNKLFGKAIIDSKIVTMYELNKKLSDELDERGDENEKERNI